MPRAALLSITLLTACGSPSAAARDAGPPPAAAAAPLVEGPAIEHAPAGIPRAVPAPAAIGPAEELSLPALADRIAAREAAGERDAALDDMAVFVFRFGAAPQSERYRAALRAHGREVRERPPLAPPRPRARPDAEPAVRVLPPRVQGSLSAELIRRVMLRRQRELLFCYEHALREQPAARGRMVVRFAISPEGRVISAAIVQSSVGSPTLDACVRSRIPRWTFPTANVPGVNVVTAPIDFRRE